MRVEIGNRHPIDRLRRMPRKPSQHMCLVAALSQNIPQRLHLPRCRRNWTDSARVRIGFHEAMDPVLVRPLSGRNRIPQHRRQDRLQGRDVPHHALADHAIQCRHQTRIQQRVCNFPVGGIPADQQHFLSQRLRQTDTCRFPGDLSLFFFKLLFSEFRYRTFSRRHSSKPSAPIASIPNEPRFTSRSSFLLL